MPIYHLSSVICLLSESSPVSPPIPGLCLCATSIPPSATKTSQMKSCFGDSGVGPFAQYATCVVYAVVSDSLMAIQNEIHSSIESWISGDIDCFHLYIVLVISVENSATSSGAFFRKIFYDNDVGIRRLRERARVRVRELRGN
ncbi:hypothetical protein BDN70DRAFT_893920 [Pholiota conissans]|uniref:Uncharacterized protein n=1 Tax=Pholiota conissans TaxID=109636 RepID=A0A9P5Z4M9_9AGAR|nr:hypothetical protein BDN70DRAFT_893920 [Pholiota conissans]